MKSMRSSSRRPSGSKGAGFVGKGCVAEVFSPGTSVCGTGRSTIGHTGLPSSRLNTNVMPVFVTCATAGIFLPRDGDVEQHRRRGQVVIPDVVMKRLEVPDALAGLGVEADERIGEQIVAVTMPAVEIAGRRLRRADRRSRAQHRR